MLIVVGKVFPLPVLASRYLRIHLITLTSAYADYAVYQNKVSVKSHVI